MDHGAEEKAHHLSENRFVVIVCRVYILGFRVYVHAGMPEKTPWANWAEL